MAIEVSGVVTLQCNQCKKTHNVQAPPADEWQEVERDERQMGPESNWEYTEEIDCSCGSTLRLTVNAWEYPEGAFNTDEYSTSDCTVGSRWNIGFQID